MWKFVDGRLIHTTDASRIRFRTTISKLVLESVEEIAEQHNTHVNYLLESGLREVLNSDVIAFDKKSRPKDRVQYNTTYDAELIDEVKEFAKNHKLFINDVIEYSTQFIAIENKKGVHHRYRIEK